MIESVTMIPPNYALVYAKLSRHVAAADAFLACNNVYGAAEELGQALEAVKGFETTFFLITKEQLND
jgi:hypothetical protein